MNGGHSHHDHNHSHEDHHDEIYSAEQEKFTVFSESAVLHLNTDELTVLREKLAEWMDGIKTWISENKFFLGHAKLFCEDEGGCSVWMSTTGTSVNIKTSGESARLSGKLSISMALIVLGTDEHRLQNQALISLGRILGGIINKIE